MKKSSVVLYFLAAISGVPEALAAGTDIAHQQAITGYFQVGEVRVKEVAPTPDELDEEPARVQSRPLESGGEGIDWSQITLIGEKIIQIVKAGKPVVEEKYSAVSALPKGIASWEQLAGWQAPATKVFSFQVTNDFGATVVDVRLKVTALWGGSFDGHGKYLANVRVVPTKVNVFWGWDLDLWTENSDPVNGGSTADPMAAFGFIVRYKTSSWFAQKNGAQDYFVSGDGKILELD